MKVLSGKIFKWGLDSEDDLVFSALGIFHFVKYKDHTLFYFWKNPSVKRAPKYLDIEG